MTFFQIAICFIFISNLILMIALITLSGMYVNVNEVFTWCPETPTYPTLAREDTSDVNAHGSGRSAGAAWKAPHEKFVIY